MVRSYKKLDVWKQSIALSAELYRLTAGFCNAEGNGLAAAIRKAATTVNTNIAAGWGKETAGEYLQFWSRARSSLMELEGHLAVACNLRIMEPQEFEAIEGPLQETAKMLDRLIVAVKSYAEPARVGRTCPVYDAECPVRHSAVAVSRGS